MGDVLRPEFPRFPLKDGEIDQLACNVCKSLSFAVVVPVEGSYQMYCAKCKAFITRIEPVSSDDEPPPEKAG